MIIDASPMYRSADRSRCHAIIDKQAACHDQIASASAAALDRGRLVVASRALVQFASRSPSFCKVFLGGEAPISTARQQPPGWHASCVLHEEHCTIPGGVIG